MGELVLQPGTVFFLPHRGLRQVHSFYLSEIGGQTYRICTHTEFYTGTSINQLETAIHDANARHVSSQSVAKTVKEKLSEPRKTNKTQNWFKDKDNRWELWLKLGTFEKNVAVLREAYHSDHHRWKDPHLRYYEEVFRLVQEEWAYVFKKTLGAAKYEIDRTLGRVLA